MKKGHLTIYGTWKMVVEGKKSHGYRGHAIREMVDGDMGDDLYANLVLSA